MTVQLVFHNGSKVDVTRPHAAASWRGNAKCPVCALRPIRVRAYHGDPPGPCRTGFVTAIAWCAGRHKSVGFLIEPANPTVLVPMGVGEPEAFRCKIY